MKIFDQLHSTTTISHKKHQMEQIHEPTFFYFVDFQSMDDFLVNFDCTVVWQQFDN